MTKVFFNDRFIILSDRQLPNSQFPQVVISNSDQVKNSIQQFDNDKRQAQLTLIGRSYSELTSLFFSNFKLLEASGGVVINNDGHYLFIFRLGKWDLPKGKREKGESIEENAIREVCEETGLSNLTIIRPLQPTYHTYHQKGDYILKKTNWFIMNYKGNETLKPQTEEYISDVKWLDRNEVQKAAENTYASIREVIAEVNAIQ